jgi:hypothetical protein
VPAPARPFSRLCARLVPAGMLAVCTTYNAEMDAPSIADRLPIATVLRLPAPLACRTAMSVETSYATTRAVCVCVCVTGAGHGDLDRCGTADHVVIRGGNVLDARRRLSLSGSASGR